jgi:hypothetical protein
MLRIVHAQALFSRVAKPGERFDEDWSDVFEKISSEGDLVARQEWDSGAPGAGAGVQYVYEFRGLFFATSDADVYGPYDKFTEAADSIGILNVNDATTSVWVSPEYRSKGTKPK